MPDVLHGDTVPASFACVFFVSVSVRMCVCVCLRCRGCACVAICEESFRRYAICWYLPSFVYVFRLSHTERDVNMKRQLVEDLKTRLKFLQEMEKSYRGQVEELEKKVLIAAHHCVILRLFSRVTGEKWALSYSAFPIVQRFVSWKTNGKIFQCR